MKNFKQFLREAVISKHDKDELVTIEDTLYAIKNNNLFKEKVLFRGMSTTNYISEVTNDRSNFHGGMIDNTREIIQNHLKIKNPTFITTDEIQASMFGPVKIYIPGKNDTFFSNEYVNDIMVYTNNSNFDSEESKVEFAKSYKKSSKLHKNRTGEVIVDTKHYYLMDYLGFIKNSFKSRKVYTPKESLKGLTYRDVYDTLKAYLGLEQWKIQQGYRKSFDNSKKDAQKSADRMNDLRKERKSDSQLSVRTKFLVSHLHKKDIEDFIVDDKNFRLEFKSQKRVKEVWKIIKPDIENRINYMKITNLSEIEFLNPSLDKKYLQVV